MRHFGVVRVAHAAHENRLGALDRGYRGGVVLFPQDYPVSVVDNWYGDRVPPHRGSRLHYGDSVLAFCIASAKVKYKRYPAVKRCGNRAEPARSRFAASLPVS